MMGEKTKGYQDLITEMACEIISGEADGDGYVSQDMQNGIDNEPYARAEYENLFDVTIKQVGFVIPDMESKYHDWIGVSPDGLRLQPFELLFETDSFSGGLEIKCPKAKTHMNYIREGVLPSEYRYQVQGQLFVTGLPFWDFMSWSKGLKPFVIRVEPDLVLHKEFERRLDILIESVVNVVKIHEGYEVLL
jgi:hypothetical protein